MGLARMLALGIPPLAHKASLDRVRHPQVEMHRICLHSQELKEEQILTTYGRMLSQKIML